MHNKQYVKDKTTHINNITNEVVNSIRSIGEAGRYLANTLCGSNVRLGGVLNRNIDNQFTPQVLNCPAIDAGKSVQVPIGGGTPVQVSVDDPSENLFTVDQQPTLKPKGSSENPPPEVVQPNFQAQ